MHRSRARMFALASGLILTVAGVVPASAAPGEVDDTFAGSGLMTLPDGSARQDVPMAPGVAGRFVLAWSSSDRINLSGFLGTGSLDGGFGSGGTSSITVADATYVDTLGIAVDAQDRTIVVGFVTRDATDSMFVARFTATGDPDTTFSGDGVRLVQIAARDTYGYGVVVRHGRIYVAGQVYESSVADVLVVRLDGSGALDPSFGKGGKRIYVVNDGFAGDDFAYRIRAVPNGRFLLAGGVGSAQGFNTLLMKIRSDGRLDRSFGNGGYRIFDLAKAADDFAYELLKDGERYVIGIRGVVGKPKILRVRSDGSRDTTFGTNGVGRYSVPDFDLIGLAIDADRRLIAVSYGAHLPVMRVRPGGALMTGFGTGGVATNPDTAANGFDVMMQGDLILVSGGDFNTSINATRYLPA